MTQVEQKIRFIEAVMNGEIRVRGRRRDEVIADMRRFDLPEELLDMTLSDFTEARLRQLKENIAVKG